MKRLYKLVMLAVMLASITFLTQVNVFGYDQSLAIDDSSTINQDLTKLNVSIPSANELGFISSFDAKTFAMFGNGNRLYVYVKISNTNYQLKQMVINNVTYNLLLLDENTSAQVRKYKIDGIQVKEKNELKVSKYNYKFNSYDLFINRKEVHLFGFDEDNYYYHCAYENTYITSGILYNKIYYDPSVYDAFFYNKQIPGINKDTYKKLFYYVFSMYDNTTGLRFQPDAISNIKVTYIERNLEVEMLITGALGFQVILYRNTIKDEKLSKQQSITAGSYQVDYTNDIKKFFNMRKSIWHDTIVSLKDYPEVATAYPDYDYIVNIGNPTGYDLKQDSYYIGIGGAGGGYVRGTTVSIEEVNIYEITYEKEGREYVVAVDSIVKDKESDDEVPEDPSEVRDDVDFMDNIKKWFEDFMENALESLKMLLIYAVLIIIGIIIVIAIIKMGFKALFKLIIKSANGLGKLINKAINGFFKFIIKILTLPFGGGR